MEHIKVDSATIKKIEFVLSKGDTAEVKPGPCGGVKVIHIQRTMVFDTTRKTK